MITWSYLAGFVDGEGTIGITHKGANAFTPYVSIANTDLEILDEICDFLSSRGYKVSRSTKPAKKKTHKTSYAISIRYDHAIRLCKSLTRHLIIKKRQALLLSTVYKFCTPRNGKYTTEQLKDKTELVKKLQSLNSRGV